MIENAAEAVIKSITTDTIFALNDTNPSDPVSEQS